MSAAGYSAGVEGRRLQAQAAEYERLAAESQKQARQWMIAHSTERQVAGKLAPLTAAGYTFLHDRGWPGSRGRAQIDHVIIGPGGLFIVDTKAWAEVEVAAGRIFRGQADVTDDFAGLADVGYGTEAALAEIGLAPGAVRVVVVFANRQMPPTPIESFVVVGESQAAKFINSHGRRLTESQVNTVLGVAITHFPVLGEPPTAIDTSILASALPEPEPEPLLSEEDVTEILLAGLLAEPIESWMSFLHPTQARLVRRSFGGPSRIRGAAGTGKTVVGLHRAAYLARAKPGKILMTSFVKTLPDVLSNLLARLAPEVAGQVEFAGVHAFASRLLRGRGIRMNVDPAGAELVFDTVWRELGVLGPLAKIDPNKSYWRDELSKVIKGRGLTAFDRYAELTRTGRRRALGMEQRREVWRLYIAYEQGLRQRGIHDFDDQILRAEASLQEHPLADYSAVIIDEAQDLSCAMVRMLHLLVGDEPDGLTLIGDGQQSIYPGGFVLSEAGISIAGRGVVLTTNYRNTREIIEFAALLVDGDQFADIDGGPGVRDEIEEVVRSGQAPVEMRFSSRGQHDAALVERLRRLDCPLADVGVLSVTTRGVRDTIRALQSAGIPTIELTEYAGRPVDAVKVGTVKRAKGLEFKQVLMSRVEPGLLGAGSMDDEARAIRRRELYVGMTRARDGLWVGVCG